jgi:hypothetical protein
MSLANLNFLFRADTENFERKLKQSRRSVNDFNSGIRSVGKLIGGAFAVDQVVEFGKACVTAFDESEKASALLLTSLDGNTESFRRLSNQAVLLQSTKLFDDEAIKGAQTFLASMKLNETQIQRILPLIMDFATKFKVDLTSAANLVAKSIGGPTNALKRYGIEAGGAAGSSERFNSILAGLTKQVGGFSKAAAEAGTSGLVLLRQAFDDIKEVLGAGLGKGLSDFARDIKGIIELRRGITQQNFATTVENEGREFAALGKSTLEARNNVASYAMEVQSGIPDLKKRIAYLDSEVKANWANGRAMRAAMFERDKLQAKLNGSIEGVSKLTDLMNNEAELGKIVAESQAGVNTETDTAVGLYGKLNEQIKINNDLIATTDDKKVIAKLRLENIELEKQKELLDAIGTAPARQTIAPMQTRGGGLIPETTNKQLKDTTTDVAGLVDQFGYLADASDNVGYKMVDMGKAVQQAFSGLGEAMGGVLGEGIANMITGSGGLEDVFSGILSLVGDFLQNLGKALIAAAAATLAFEELAINPIAAAALGLAAIIAGSVVKNLIAKGPDGQKVPALAKGGLAYAPSMAIVGDNPNAQIDPEVIAPLSKLQGMMSVSVSGRTKLRGKDIYVVWDQENQFKNRT